MILEASCPALRLCYPSPPPNLLLLHLATIAAAGALLALLTAVAAAGYLAHACAC